ncbi:MAG: UDP-N-acetylglucosamine 1-carboxyvinyltransferase, partial [Bacillota bacterium]
MERLVIAGGWPLSGTTRIRGAKNATLPILGAALLTNQKTVIHDAPRLSDVRNMQGILAKLGADVTTDGSSIIVDSSQVNSWEIPENLMREMRSSIFLMGPLLGRFGKVRVSYPGGCAIGSRPIDLHLKGLSALGAEIVEKHGYIHAEAAELKGAEIHLDFPSVGATENIMMAAVRARGQTIIGNAAKEPEIVDLQNFLNGMGAKIRGAGTDVIKIDGVTTLGSVEYTVIPDRIVAGTMMLAAAITGGDVVVENIIIEHLEPIIHKLRETGVEVIQGEDQVRVIGHRPLTAVDIRTLPHPGFPTDLQAPMMALLAVAQGTSMVTETIFDGRYKHVDELRRMGANIKTEGRTAVIKGVP